ncbi:carbamoyl-phosphate synthase (glutamine-hydrolyzing) [Clostridia bacterium]|nr:carbamoyl-phosphate synthase (glutamine-hydrolyzing) [Clostridia bacterium]
MPRDMTIRRVLVIGSGPIVIGQAAEFDYAGTQACRALRENGVEVILVNSNPATIMTDNAMADNIYIEPLTITTLQRIIEKERPDSILSGLGGQTGLTLCMQLAKSGFLARHNVRLLGASPETIDKAEDRLQFKETMEKINQPCVASEVVTTVQAAADFAREIGYPVIVRPAFTLGGSGGGIAKDERSLREIAKNGLMQSPITQILVERCISGWKEIEFEVMRDSRGNSVAVCSMENLDPVGIHTGDSIVVAPALTLADREYQMLRTAALNIIQALGVEGGCNCQFALNPESFEYAVIEVNPRVSRSSALASKATGYPIAKVAAKIAIGFTLDEIISEVTGKTSAAFEPTLDYIALKFPKWPFDKFVYAKNELGTQMKATGEVMTIADSFELALMKAVRGAEIGLTTLRLPKLSHYSDERIFEELEHTTDERIFVVYEALSRGVPVEDLHQLTMIDEWFLHRLKNLVDIERGLSLKITDEIYLRAKKAGFLDATIEKLSGKPLEVAKIHPVYRMVDTCAAEFRAETPYFYATYDAEMCEASELIDSAKPTVVVVGSGPIRIGQGIEFDYASVHCVWALRKLGYQVAIINNNPETVSTDFDTADRLYFEPLTPEDALNIIRIEKPVGVIVAFGGQTAIRLTKTFRDNNVPILGTSADSIDEAEDRARFDALLESLNIKRPKGETVRTESQALAAAERLGYPVLMRPSYVLGGQNMIIAHERADIIEYMEVILRGNPDNIVLIDQYIAGLEIEVDAICDGEDILIPGIMEHVERTGVHSGDSIAVYPAPSVGDLLAARVTEITRRLCLALKVRGLMNLQYIVAHGEVFVIEVNPRASRTVPYLSKVTGVPICELATRVIMNEPLADLGYGVGLRPNSPYTAVKAPVFSFEKLTDVDTQLGPEMKSTGEVLGLGKNLEEALFKALVAAGYNMRRDGGVLITVRKTDKSEVADVAKKFARMGFKLYATRSTAEVCRRSGLSVTEVQKVHKSEDDAPDNIINVLESGAISYVISTSAKGRDPARDSVKIRRKACLLGIPCLTSLDTAGALADSLRSRYSERNTELVDINHLRSRKMKLKFTKMQGLGNDYIYINCFEQEINSPESLSVFLSDRRLGVGGDGVILIRPSKVADARMQMFNLDGSEGKMCGNGIRCVAKYLYDNGLVNRTKLTVETLSGIRAISLRTRGGYATTATVDMGAAVWTPAEVPVKLEGERVVNREISVDGKNYAVTCVSMGNPHCVTFMDGVDALNLDDLGPKFEFNPLFPDRVNTEFVEVIDRRTLKMRVWERGSGETHACGTGACAVVAAAVANNICDSGTDVRVMLVGGDLTVNYTDERVLMTGAAETVYEGTVEI